jgi:hypothetical protein
VGSCLLYELANVLGADMRTLSRGKAEIDRRRAWEAGVAGYGGERAQADGLPRSRGECARGPLSRLERLHSGRGIELLTGIPAGQRGADGQFPDSTLHARVEERLERWARMAEENVAAG